MIDLQTFGGVKVVQRGITAPPTTLGIHVINITIAPVVLAKSFIVTTQGLDVHLSSIRWYARLTSSTNLEIFLRRDADVQELHVSWEIVENW